MSVREPCACSRLDGHPVGCVALGSLEDGIGEVERMYLDPGARGHRIGRLLLERVEEPADSRGHRLLRLETGTEQPEALQLHRSAGWREIPCYGYSRDHPGTVCSEKPTALRGHVPGA